jgi:hypothetical protein
MIKLWLQAVALFSTLLCSCDPSRRIEMINRTSDTVEVVWKSQEDSIGFNPFVLNNNKKLVFVLPPRKHNKVKLSFGMGTWTPDDVAEAIHLLDYFSIKSPHQSLRIDSLPQLQAWLLERRTGIGNSRIVISIDH